MSHQQYVTTLGELTGRVLSVKPNLPPTMAQDFINDAIRVICDRKQDWTGLFVERDLYVPPIYSTGNVTMTQGSDHVTGTGTAWDVSTTVNTNIPAGISRTGYQACVPASMTGITVDTMLYVTDGSSTEIVYVKSTTSTSFTATFNQFFNPGATVTVSNLAGRQLKLGYTYPVYTVMAVVSPTELIIDNPWHAATLTSSGYEIKKMYYTMEPGLKSIVSIIDPTQGIPPLRVNIPAQGINRIDPQRSATGFPQLFATRGPNANGNMQYELWPASQTERQLRAMINLQPPKLTSEGDFIPAFMNPTVIFNYAASIAKRTRMSVDDPYYDLAASQTYMQLFEVGFDYMVVAHDQLTGTDLSWTYGTYGLPGGADWERSHSWDAWAGNV